MDSNRIDFKFIGECFGWLLLAGVCYAVTVVVCTVGGN